MNAKLCVVIGAAKKGPSRSLLSRYAQLDGPNRATVYCADGGLHNAEILKLRTDLLIGDFDSIKCSHNTEAKNSYKFKTEDIHETSLQENRIENLIRLPSEKDETDLFACVLQGLKTGVEEFILIYCTGGRLDHFMGSIAILEYINGQGAKGMILDRQNQITLLKEGEICITKDSNYRYLSLIPLDQMLLGVNMTGVKYPLKDATILREKGLSISNEICEDKAIISIRGGSALIIKSRD